MRALGFLSVGVTVGVILGAVGIIAYDITMLALGHYGDD